MSSFQSPKLVSYSTTGGGRDTYISQNNGGLLKNQFLKASKQTNHYYESGTMQKNNTVVRFVGIPLPNKITNYVSDGNGRDQYILQSNVYQNNHSLKGNQYLNNLRNYGGKPRQVRDSDVFTLSQFQQSPKNKKETFNLSRRQMSKSDVLSRPKKFNQTFSAACDYNNNISNRMQTENSIFQKSLNQMQNQYNNSYNVSQLQNSQWLPKISQNQRNPYSINNNIQQKQQQQKKQQISDEIKIGKNEQYYSKPVYPDYQRGGGSPLDVNSSDWGSPRRRKNKDIPENNPQHYQDPQNSPLKKRKFTQNKNSGANLQRQDYYAELAQRFKTEAI